jgi:hypothetical protein
MVLHLDTLLHPTIFGCLKGAPLPAGRVPKRPDPSLMQNDGPGLAKRTARASAARMTEGNS